MTIPHTTTKLLHPGAVPVVIERPKTTGAVLVGRIIGSAASVLLRAWLLMLVAPSLGWRPSYWVAVGAVIAANALVPTSAGQYQWWTREPRR